MTQIAVLDGPRDVAVVARAAELPVNYFEHVHVVTPGFEFEAQIGMTYFASKARAMKPVRKHDWTYASFV